MHELTRRFGDRAAVDRISFEVPKGQIAGFLGPNGAGKSTTLKMLSGFLPPTSGTARIGGFDVVEDGVAARRLLGYMPESFPVHPEMRVEEYLSFRAELKGVRANRKAAVARAMELADVTDVARRLVGELSKGYKQRVGLADAVVSSPPLLILDEPTEGLDPNQILRFREVLRELGREHTILLSTHILSEVEAVCSHVVIIRAGRIAATGSLESVRADMQGAERTVALTLALRGEAEGRWARDADGAAKALCEPVAGVALVHASAAGRVGRAELRVRSDDAGAEAVEALVARCVAEGLGVREVTPKAHSLEEVFHELTRREESAAKGGDA